MPRDINDRVADYRGLVESLAAKLSRSPSSVRVGAEYDDLVQEGLIFVWQSIGRGVEPKGDLIEGRMLNWIRLMGRQLGGDPVAYEALLPLDDFRVVQEQQ